MRAGILAGRLKTGQKLPFAELVKQYECSIGALREALQRLTVQGLVTSEVQQGFRVTSVSKNEVLVSSSCAATPRGSSRRRCSARFRGRA